MFQPAATVEKSSPILRENYELLWTSVKHGMISGMISDMTVHTAVALQNAWPVSDLAPQMEEAQMGIEKIRFYVVCADLGHI